LEKESNMQDGYRTAYKKACAALAKSDPYQISQSSGATYNKETNRLLLPYLGSDYLINCSTGEVERTDDTAPVTTTVKVLMLHYLLNAVKRAPTGKMISFRDVRGGGANYYPTFSKRAIIPLQKTFENNIELLVKASEPLSGVAESFGDASVTLPVFPHVPVTYVIWQGDEEISSSASILFDANINSYLPCEDIVLAASFGVYALMKVAGSLK
jgi:hypothetical protein